jgi:hypothetical protein
MKMKYPVMVITIIRNEREYKIMQDASVKANVECASCIDMTDKEFVADKNLSLYSESIRKVMSEGKKAYANRIISEM